MTINQAIIIMKSVSKKITASVFFVCIAIAMNSAMASTARNNNFKTIVGTEISQGMEVDASVKDRKMKKKKKKKNKHLCSAYSY